jgi:hypothetical protein
MNSLENHESWLLDENLCLVFVHWLLGMSHGWEFLYVKWGLNYIWRFTPRSADIMAFSGKFSNVSVLFGGSLWYAHSPFIHAFILERSSPSYPPEPCFGGPCWHFPFTQTSAICLCLQLGSLPQIMTISVSYVHSEKSFTYIIPFNLQNNPSKWILLQRGYFSEK